MHDSKKVALLLVVLFSSILLISCGGDDPPKPPGPDSITAVGGDLYKGAMGSALTIPIMQFEVKDADGELLPDVMVLFRAVIGDGSIVDDTVTTSSSGVAACGYNFSGDLGHAVIQAKVAGVDSALVSVRANTLIPGPGGQAQYVHFDDNYGDVKDWIGPPGRVDNDPTYWINYAVYENQLGVVVVLEDADQNSLASDDEAVVGVIVNGIYSGTTSLGLGIGSTMNDVQTNYGVVTGVYDPTPPAAYKYVYNSVGFVIYTDTNPTESLREVFEIHMQETVTIPSRVSAEQKIGLFKRYSGVQDKIN